MAEMIRVTFDRVTIDDAEFDRVVHDGLPEAGDLRLVVKDKATMCGKPGVAITFTAQTDSGPRMVQAVTTVELLVQMVSGIAARYPEAGDRRWPKETALSGDVVDGVHRGMKWEATLFERMYLVRVCGVPGAVSIAGSDRDAKAAGEGMIDQKMNG